MDYFIGFSRFDKYLIIDFSVSTMIAGTAAAVHVHTLAAGGTMHAMSAI